ncbi:MAG: DsbA family protein [Candidatus Kerfeldbacteria bacterium]|nr:DsbA family protein [Candidatus Kerfeldbacteria bacterium]
MPSTEEQLITNIKPAQAPRRPLYRRLWVWVLGILLLFWFGLPLVLKIFSARQDNSQAGGFTAAPNKSASASAGLQEVATTDDPSLGSPVAPIVVVEFGDFECPYCREAEPIIKQVLQKYPEAVRLIYRDFPVIELHAEAVPAAEAANCALKQGKFWAYHDGLFQQQDQLGEALYLSLARTLNLDLDKFNQCRQAHLTLADIQDDLAAGTAAGVRGTPTWFINGQKVEGVLPLDIWDKAITAALRRKFGK